MTTIPVIFAHPSYLIDQRNDETTGTWAITSEISISAWSPIGQEFIPTKSALIAVDVFLVQYGNETTDVNLYIREGSITGKIVASETFSVTEVYFWIGWKHIHITPVATLTVGATYVLQLEHDGHNLGVVLEDSGFDTYPDGTFIFLGVPQVTSTSDIGFRTYSPYGVDSTDITGKQINSFNIPETVYVCGKEYSPSTSYDLYVIEDTTLSDGMDIPDPFLGTETSVTTDASGRIPKGTVAWSGPLTLGKYDIIVDVNGNGRYDLGIDAIDDDDIKVTAGFFVIPELPLGTITALVSLMAGLLLFTKRPTIK